MRTRGHVIVVALSLGCSPRVTPGPETWRASLAGHVVRDGSSAGSLRYRVQRGCLLGYEWSSRVQMDVLSLPRAAPPIVMESTGRAEADEDPGARGRLVMPIRWHQLTVGSPDTRNPGGSDEDFAAPVWLRTDGRTWTEEDGPTAMWSAYGTTQGLVRFFPTLPGGAGVGARGSWRFRVHAEGSGLAVEARRGRTVLPEGTSPPTPQGEDQTYQITLTRWITVDGHPVAVLESVGSGDRRAVQQLGAAAARRITTTQRWRSRGAHLVLARTGRMLLSRFEDVHDIRMRGAGANMQQRQTVQGELRLVSACDGPTLASPVRPRTAAERSLDEAAWLRNALVQGDRAAVLRSLSPALRARHGDAVVDLLLRHVRWHGPRSIGNPELASDAPVRIGDGAWRVRVAGGAANVGGEPDATTVETVMEVEPSGDEMVVRSIRTSSMPGRDDRDVLDVSTERLFSDAQRDE
ncbi:MAG: hypothetical protein Q8S73_05750 [Deltaproteobacteria bacterium]|nr:hypothetical protein [Myxococcales bacterium]MDP3213586.1 hypothetical protein [Deltaproteobacteria bacterium]